MDKGKRAMLASKGTWIDSVSLKLQWYNSLTNRALGSAGECSVDYVFFGHIKAMAMLSLRLHQKYVELLDDEQQER